jgi:hypothetical protein
MFFSLNSASGSDSKTRQNKKTFLYITPLHTFLRNVCNGAAARLSWRRTECSITYLNRGTIFLSKSLDPVPELGNIRKSFPDPTSPQASQIQTDLTTLGNKRNRSDKIIQSPCSGPPKEFQQQCFGSGHSLHGIRIRSRV